MQAFTIENLQAIAREVIGDPGITLRPDETARDVPGWDSLNHTLIIMEVNERLGIELKANRAAKARDFAQLLHMIEKHLSRRPD